MASFPGLPPLGGGTIINNQIGTQASIDNTTGNDATVAATIVVAPIPPDDSNALYSVASDPLSIYTDYEIRNYYENDRITYMLGMSSPGGFNGQSVAAAQLASPTLLWLADWTAARTNSIPEVPDPFSVSSAWVLLDVQLELAKLTLMADGVTPLYRISGTYAFGCLNPDDNAFNNINFPRPPWLLDQFTRTVSLNQLKDNLITAGITVTLKGGGVGGGNIGRTAPFPGVS